MQIKCPWNLLPIHQIWMIGRVLSSLVWYLFYLQIRISIVYFAKPWHEEKERYGHFNEPTKNTIYCFIHKEKGKWCKFEFVRIFSFYFLYTICTITQSRMILIVMFITKKNILTCPVHFNNNCNICNNIDTVSHISHFLFSDLRCNIS